MCSDFGKEVVVCWGNVGEIWGGHISLSNPDLLSNPQSKTKILQKRDAKLDTNRVQGQKLWIFVLFMHKN